MKYFMIITALLTVLLGGCAPQTAPTIDPAEVQASAVAAAGTMIAQTQAAIPPTPVPSSTPQPSPTSIPLPAFPTSAFPTTAATANSGTGDPCSAPLPSNPPGPKANLALFNKSSAQANISIYVSKTKFGQCGYRGYALAKGDSATISDIPLSCYSVYAFINDPKKPTHSAGSGCWNNPDRLYIVVTNTIVHLTVTHP
jgi:hypothetical protein